MITRIYSDEAIEIEPMPGHKVFIEFMRSETQPGLAYHEISVLGAKQVEIYNKVENDERKEQMGSHAEGQVTL